MSCLAVLDPDADRIVFFGGWGFAYYADAWSLELDGGMTWSPLAPKGTPPAARLEHTTIYDPLRHRMVLFGGKDSSTFYNDTWELSLDGDPAWRQIPTGSAPSQRETRAVYDPLRDRMVIFGGFGETAYGRAHLNETWAMPLDHDASWQQLAPLGAPPPPRRGQSAVYDPVRDRILVFGGYDDAQWFSDVWALSLSGTPTWTQLAPLGPGPAARYGHVAAYDPRSDRMVIAGGYYDDVVYRSIAAPATGRVAGRAYILPPPPPIRVPHFLDDTWALSLSGVPTWSRIAQVDGDPTPEPRDFSTAVFVPARDEIVMFGGNADSAVYGDVWALRAPGTAHAQHMPLAPPAEEPPSGADGNPARLTRDGGHVPRLTIAIEGTRLAFTLTGDPGARLEAFDVAGRRCVSIDLAGLAPGPHEMELPGAGALRAGVYIVRVSEGRVARTARVVVVR